MSKNHPKTVELEEENLLKEIQLKAHSRDALYSYIIEKGRALTADDPSNFDHTDRVQGCQSTLLCRVRMSDNRIKLKLYSDALITRGLASIIQAIVDGQLYDEVLRYQPKIFTENGLGEAISAARLQGAGALLLHIKQQIIAALTSR